jgi:pantoate--beta-alanine ligase
MLIARTLADLRRNLSELGPVGLVPTMGALHRGHLSLITAAKDAGLPVAASIFVNPTQFSPSEDFNVYPRDEPGDLALLEAAGCDLVWLPTPDIMYPKGHATTIHIAGPAMRWEGHIRPTHFAGVATVVAKLLAQIRPAAAYFGEKDWQQIQVISRMVEDLLIPTTITAVPTFRETDGLALSSRNRFLLPGERAIAPVLYAALTHAAKNLTTGHDVETTLQNAKHQIADAGLTPDYVAFVHAQTLEPLTSLIKPSRLLAAARLKHVRLLDNIAVV